MRTLPRRDGPKFSGFTRTIIIIWTPSLRPTSVPHTLICCEHTVSREQMTRPETNTTPKRLSGFIRPHEQRLFHEVSIISLKASQWGNQWAGDGLRTMRVSSAGRTLTKPKTGNPCACCGWIGRKPLTNIPALPSLHAKRTRHVTTLPTLAQSSGGTGNGQRRRKSLRQSRPLQVHRGESSAELADCQLC